MAVLPAISYSIVFAQDINTLKTGVVRIENSRLNEVGTGFIVKVDGNQVYIVTAAHVVKGDQHPIIYVFNQQHDGLQAEVLDREDDDIKGLALLRLKVRSSVAVGITALKLSYTSELSGGEDIKVIGFPDATAFWTVVNGSVARIEGRNLVFSGGIRSGASGGPVILNGLVIGLVTDISQSSAYAARGEVIEPYVNGIVPKLIRVGTPITTLPENKASSTNYKRDVTVRGDNVTNGWTNSGLVVEPGQRINITSSGTISIGHNRTSTPEGLTSLTDSGKLMRNEPTGGLIAVIGDDNDEFIFIGSGREFVAGRGGVLFLGVNEGYLNDNTGAYNASIVVHPLANKYVEVDVRADNRTNGWTNSGIAVRQGQRLKISASGMISLGALSQTLCPPSGFLLLKDKNKLMQNEPTGGLVAVIGDDNDGFIFIGSGREFVAGRDGVLFLGVNEGYLNDNSGAFRAIIVY
jgi:hypothetical protein